MAGRKSFPPGSGLVFHRSAVFVEVAILVGVGRTHEVSMHIDHYPSRPRRLEVNGVVEETRHIICKFQFHVVALREDNCGIIVANNIPAGEATRRLIPRKPKIQRPIRLRMKLIVVDRDRSTRPEAIMIPIAFFVRAVVREIAAHAVARRVAALAEAVVQIDVIHSDNSPGFFRSAWNNARDAGA